MTALLFYTLLYTGLGMACAFGIRFIGIRDWTHEHDGCPKNCKRYIGRGQMPLIGWLTSITLWPFITFMVLTAWIIRILYFVLSIKL